MLYFSSLVWLWNNLYSICFQSKWSALHFCSEWLCPWCLQCTGQHVLLCPHTRVGDMVHSSKPPMPRISWMVGPLPTAREAKPQKKTIWRKKWKVMTEEYEFYENNAGAASCTCLEFAGVFYKINSRDGIKKYYSKDWGLGRAGASYLFCIVFQDKFKRRVKGGRCLMAVLPKQKATWDRKESVKALWQKVAECVFSS